MSSRACSTHRSQGSSDAAGSRRTCASAISWAGHWPPGCTGRCSPRRSSSGSTSWCSSGQPRDGGAGRGRRCDRRGSRPRRRRGRCQELSPRVGRRGRHAIGRIRRGRAGRPATARSRLWLQPDGPLGDPAEASGHSSRAGIWCWVSPRGGRCSATPRRSGGVTTSSRTPAARASGASASTSLVDAAMMPPRSTSRAPSRGSSAASLMSTAMRPGAAWRSRSRARPSRRSRRAAPSADRRARSPCHPLPWSPRRAPTPRRPTVSQRSPLARRDRRVARLPGSQRIRGRPSRDADEACALFQPTGSRRPGDRAYAGEQATATRTTARPARTSPADRQATTAGPSWRHRLRAPHTMRPATGRRAAPRASRPMPGAHAPARHERDPGAVERRTWLDEDGVHDGLGQQPDLGTFVTLGGRVGPELAPRGLLVDGVRIGEHAHDLHRSIDIEPFPPDLGGLARQRHGELRPRPRAPGLGDGHERASVGQPRGRDQDVGTRQDLIRHLVPDASGLPHVHRLEPAVR